MCEYIFHYIDECIYMKNITVSHMNDQVIKTNGKPSTLVMCLVLISAQLFPLHSPECVLQMV